MKKIVLLLLLAIGVVSCDDHMEGTLFSVADLDPIAAGLAEYPEYSTYVSLLKRVDLYNALNLSNYAFTVFVVSNENIENYIKYYTEYESIDDMPDDEVRYLMEYHIISGASYVASDLYLQLATATVTGKYLTAGISSVTGDRYIDNGDDKTASNLIVKDMEFTNGYVHEIDNMLQPVTASIWDIVSANSDYRIFSDIIEACGLVDLLDRREVEINGTMVDEEKTIFVVTDYAFNEARIEKLEDMLELYPTGDPMEEYSDLHQWMLYHIMLNSRGYADLTTFPSQLDEANFPSNSHNLETMASNTMLSIIDQSNTIYLNPHDATNGNITFNQSKMDVPAMNGYIHEVSGLLNIPTTVGHYTFIWDILESNLEFRTLSNYGYVNRTDLAERTDDIDKDLVSDFITWNTIPTSAADVYYSNTGNEEHVNGDAFVFYLGSNGYIDFTTPTLSAGSITPYIVRGVTASTGGHFNILQDGTTFKTNFYMNYDIYTYTATTAFTHSESGPLKLRFEPNSSLYGYAGFDVIVFKAN